MMIRRCHVLGLWAALAAGCAADPAGETDGGLTCTEAGCAPSGPACLRPEGPQTQTLETPAERKFDFLLLVDNSGSMCEEQANLAASLDVLARFLWDELGDGVDFRVAAITTDLRTDTEKGRFADRVPGPSPNCGGDMAPPSDVCGDASAEGGGFPFGAVLASGSAERGGNAGATREEFVAKLSCLALRGTGGDGFEKGLEAMRLALSCEGPNKAHFSACCVDKTDANGQVLASTYDPQCAAHLNPADAPRFLRPDATLAVVILSDEVDCSSPADNPRASRRPICKFGPQDTNRDGVADGYTIDGECEGLDAQACYTRDCADLTPELCYPARCVIDRGDNNNCEWYGQALTPVSDYADFLRSLKSEPERQLVVTTVVGQRGLVELGGRTVEVSHVPGRPAEACWYAPGANSAPNTSVSKVSAECCPEGVCTGGPAPTCDSPLGQAFNGRRYLQLAEAFGTNGVGCAPGTEGQPECHSICDGDLSAPLTQTVARLRANLGRMCLDGAPACRVPAKGGATRPCETDEERSDAAHFAPGVRVTVECAVGVDAGGGCETIIPSTVLASGEYRVFHSAECASDFALELAQAPPAGGRVTVEFEADPESPCDPAPVAPDAGVFVPPPVPPDAAVIVPDGAAPFSADAGR